jgi:hypothetical protein
MSVTEAEPTGSWGDDSPPLPGLAVVARSAALLAAEGVSLGLAGWSIRIGDPLAAYILANTLAYRARAFVVTNIAAGAFVGLFVAALVLARRRRSGTEILRRLSLRLAPLCVAWFLPALVNWKLWQGRELQFLALVALLGLALQRLVRLSLSTPSAFSAPSPRWMAWLGAWMARATTGWPPLLLVIAGATGYAVFFSFHTIRNTTASRRRPWISGWKTTSSGTRFTGARSSNLRLWAAPRRLTADSTRRISPTSWGSSIGSRRGLRRSSRYRRP